MNRKVLLFAAGGAIALLVVWFVLLWSPQGARLEDAGTRRDAAESTNSQLELRLERLRDLRERRPQLQADLDALETAIPESPELDTFLLDTDAAAERAGVDITSVSPAKPTPSEAEATAATTTTTTAPAAGAAGAAGADVGATAASSPSAITVSLEAAGGYFQVLDFLNRLDDLPRVVVVDSLSLTSAEGAAGGEGAAAPQKLAMSITARMFTTAPPPAAEGEADTTASTTTTAPSGATAGGAGQ